MDLDLDFLAGEAQRFLKRRLELVSTVAFLLEVDVLVVPHKIIRFTSWCSHDNLGSVRCGHITRLDLYPTVDTDRCFALFDDFALLVLDQFVIIRAATRIEQARWGGNLSEAGDQLGLVSRSKMIGAVTLTTIGFPLRMQGGLRAEQVLACHNLLIFAAHA